MQFVMQAEVPAQKWIIQEKCEHDNYVWCYSSRDSEKYWNEYGISVRCMPGSDPAPDGNP